jgi:hypothetical protein
MFFFLSQVGYRTKPTLFDLDKVHVLSFAFQKVQEEENRKNSSE